MLGFGEMRGTLLFNLGKYEEALASFRKAYSLNDDGWIYILLEDV